MRGRLINPFLVVIGRLDTVKTRTEDPDGDGPLTGGYDDVFRAPHIVEDTTTGKRVEVREESIIQLPAQIEDRRGEGLQQLISGDSPQSAMVLTFHFIDLEKLGLVADDGVAKIHKNDRLIEIRRMCAGNPLVQEIRTPPGLYVVEVTPAGFGLEGERNLLRVTLEERDIGTAVR